MAKNPEFNPNEWQIVTEIDPNNYNRVLGGINKPTSELNDSRVIEGAHIGNSGKLVVIFDSSINTPPPNPNDQERERHAGSENIYPVVRAQIEEILREKTPRHERDVEEVLDKIRRREEWADGLSW